MIKNSLSKALSHETILVIVALLMVLIPLGIFAIISINHSTQVLTDRIKKELQEKLILVTYDINNFITERIIDARIISQANVLEGHDIAATSKYFSEVVDANKWIDDIDALSLDGKIIASSGTKNEKGQYFWNTYPIDKAFFFSAIKGTQGQVYVSEAKKLDTGPGILFLTPITDESNKKTIALLTLEVNLNNISELIKLFIKGIIGDKYVYIVNNSGQVIISDNPSITFMDIFPDLNVQPKLLTAFSIQGARGNLIYTDSVGEKVMAGYADMAEFGVNKALDWNIITISPMEKITQPTKNLRNFLLIIAVIITFFSLFIIYRLVISYNKKLKNISLQANAISKGDYSGVPLITSKRKGAINTLVSAFNQMKSNIKILIEDLHDREQRLDIMLNSIGDAVLATDEKGNVTHMNPIAIKLTGWKFKDAKGLSIKTIFTLIDEKTRKPITNPIDRVLAGNTVHLGNHTTLITKDGVEYQIEDSAAPIRRGNNNILGMILIFKDVTRRKQAEKQYRRSVKMDALGKLTGGIAHDYNNMLGVILGYSELLKDNLQDQPKFIKYIDVINSSAQRGAKLTQKLLDFSKHKQSEIKILNLNLLIQNQQFMLEKTLTVRIKLILNLTADLWFVRLDESDTIDTILNICINAMHAIEANGQITIHTSNEKINQIDAKVLNLSAGDYVLLNISDTGCGMDESIKDKIFDPFFSTKGENGTGLGLSQVYGFIQRSHGTIKVYSEIGHGTRLALYFPRHYENKKLEPSQEEKTPTKITGTETILVVDDETDLRDFCCLALENHGFTTIAAENAKHALQILEEKNIDLLLSDIIMPEMDGYQLASIVQEKYPKVKIQLASGFSSERGADFIDKKLQQKILLKPYNSQALLQAVHNLLNH